MASIDDVDLIDLDSSACLTRVPATAALTQEEQEHLLDVCPPKLEQKLSLTRRQQQEIASRGDELDAPQPVLVTLGHEQIVPIRKRIDVVSSDTIKRVRDITKNLEPVMVTRPIESEDQIDAMSQINDAFNFLSELEDEDSLSERRQSRPEVIIRHPLVENIDRPKSMIRRQRMYASFGMLEKRQPPRHAHKRNCSGSARLECRCEPSTSEGRQLCIGSSSTSMCSSARSSCSDCSDCSSVDWSWVEEVDRHCAEVPAPAAPRGIPSAEPPSRSSCASAPAVWRGQESSAVSVAMSVAAATTDKSTSTSVCQATNTSPQLNVSSSTSWLRASMRRLRHLRMPEAPESPVAAPVSLPDIALVAPEILAAQTNGTSLRPSSAPAPGRGTHVSAPVVSEAGLTRGQGNGYGVSSTPVSPRNNGSQGRNGRVTGRGYARGTRHQIVANDSTTCTSSSMSTGSSATTSPASSPAASPQRPLGSGVGRRLCDRQRDLDSREDERGEDNEEDENPLGKWPHALSPALACLGCTLGLFNISRFSILSIQFGANFIVQFLILSFILGIPILTLQVCLGQRLSAGAVDMWRISPLFQGVGIALLLAQAFIGIYSIIGVSWIFVYFRDSFITKTDKYRWAEPFTLFRDEVRPISNITTYKLPESVPDYFNEAVLQRHHTNEPEPSGAVTLKFQVAFNLAVVWMIVFVSLSKGLRSYGKVVYVFTLIPIFGTLVLCTKLLGLTPPGSIHQLFPATAWNEFFINSKSWMAASTEVFLTWGLLGAAAMQIAAHNKHKHLLQRDTSLVIVLTFVVLLLAAFLANTCVQILKYHGYVYTTTSFEKTTGYNFLRLLSQPVPAGYSSVSEKFMPHASFLVGQRVMRPGADLSTESGYQALRLATELVPATLALLGTETVSPFWAVLFYFILILFGIAQQLAIWHCVITGIMAINAKTMKLWETTITFFSCACAYVLGLPMATELGIFVVYYLDYTIGGAWWIIVLYLIQIGAVFAVRGRPHSGEAVVSELFPPSSRCRLRHWAGPLLSFTWNVILPISFMVLSISIFKSSGFRELYNYRRTGREYWAVWARQLGAVIQLVPILLIPAVAIIQTCRYLNSGPPDIFDNDQVEVNTCHCNHCSTRIQLLYRPSLEPDDHQTPPTQIGADGSTTIHGNGILPSTTELPFEDPPPKYTPPPSYTTATGARIAKMLRQSFRRSVRRIASVLGESSAPSRTRPALQPPPPDYAAVLVEMNHHQIIPAEIPSRVLESRTELVERPVSPERRRATTLDRMATMRISTIEHQNHFSTLQRAPSSGTSNLTAVEVANLLRSSMRRGTSRAQHNHQSGYAHEPRHTASVENLVEAAAPISQDYSFSKDVSLVSAANDVDDDKKTAGDSETNPVSVI